MDSKFCLQGFERIYRQMEYYHRLALRSSCPVQRLQYETQMLEEVQNFLKLLRQRVQETVPEKQFTLTELASYDGSGGRPAYVAVNGIVYDVSTEPTWGGGTHFGLYAGKDLTPQFAGCHGMLAVLAKLPKVGVLVGG